MRFRTVKRLNKAEGNVLAYLDFFKTYLLGSLQGIKIYKTFLLFYGDVITTLRMFEMTYRISYKNFNKHPNKTY